MYLINNARIVNEGRSFKGSVLVKDDKIEAIYKAEPPREIMAKAEIIDGSDCWLLPGAIDCHVHFRDPGMTEKGDFATESAAAVAGGVTSIMDMPNTIPATTTVSLWEEKMAIAAAKSLCNYSCYIGATADNLSELTACDPTRVCGIKLFMGSTTGAMAINDEAALAELFKNVKLPIVVHAEDDAIIAANAEHYKKLYPDGIPVECHSAIRSDEACFSASARAVDLARKHSARLHLAHISTQKELALLENKAVRDKQITGEACVHYLSFSSADYDKLGAKIKCNPSLKTDGDRRSLLQALSTGKIDTVATDHAPHLMEQKQGDALTAASGMPEIQFALPAMLEFAKKGEISIETIVEKMCHNPALLFGIEKRGFIRKGYAADLVLVNRNSHWAVTKDCILSKCGWSPYENRSFTTKVACTFVNGVPVYENGVVKGDVRGRELRFVRG